MTQGASSSPGALPPLSRTSSERHRACIPGRLDRPKASKRGRAPTERAYCLFVRETSHLTFLAAMAIAATGTLRLRERAPPEGILHIPKSDSRSARLTYRAAQESCVVRKLKRQELSQLEENFRSYIQPFLDGEDTEDYDLIWGWQKFVYDKSQRIQASKRSKQAPVLLNQVLPTSD